jgi:hypothetical protein
MDHPNQMAGRNRIGIDLDGDGPSLCGQDEVGGFAWRKKESAVLEEKDRAHYGKQGGRYHQNQQPK